VLFNNKVTAFHQVPAALKLVLAGPVWPFLALENDSCLASRFFMSKVLFSLQLTTALLSTESDESVTWQHSEN